MSKIAAFITSIALMASVVLSGVLLPGAATAQSEDPPWKWTAEQMRERIGRVRAGRDLTPESWPGGNRVAVSLSFDVDTEPVWISFVGQETPSYMSRGEYGARAGFRRVMELLDEQKIPATFFVPAATFMLHENVAEALKSRPQHEVGFHSFIHENPLKLDPAEERAVYEKAIAYVTEAVGRRPVGFRSAAWDLSESTVAIVRDLGFLYDSSLMADDSPYQLIAGGEETPLVELPVEWILDDWPYFQLAWSANLHGLRNPDDVYAIWKSEFDEAYREGTTFVLTMHPQVIGHRHRMAMLRRLVAYMQSREGVWFATHEAIVRHVIAEDAKNKP
ncbi:MAG: polysaccharide deacetylase [Myxococcales bacterium]|nr:polysaccharide deacetylase [Myxococcales bacterium]